MQRLAWKALLALLSLSLAITLSFSCARCVYVGCGPNQDCFACNYGLHLGAMHCMTADRLCTLVDYCDDAWQHVKFLEVMFVSVPNGETKRFPVVVDAQTIPDTLTAVASAANVSAATVHLGNYGMVVSPGDLPGDADRALLINSTGYLIRTNTPEDKPQNEQVTVCGYLQAGGTPKLWGSSSLESGQVLLVALPAASPSEQIVVAFRYSVMSPEDAVAGLANIQASFVTSAESLLMNPKFSVEQDTSSGNCPP